MNNRFAHNQKKKRKLFLKGKPAGDTTNELQPQL